MTTIALFHSALGIRRGVDDAAARLRDMGHAVSVVDQYDGRAFDDLAVANAYVEERGFPALMQAALDATADLDDGFVVAGFSNGAGMAEHVALHRRVAGAVLLSGALPLSFLGADAWPGDVPVQLHYAQADPFRDDTWVEATLADIRSSGARVEFHEYAAAGHLFTDESIPDEYDAEASELLWAHVRDFLDSLAG
jgi:dienelactone hydrolase